MPGGFTTGQEVGPPDPEQRQVSGQSAASRLNVCRSLLQRQRQPT
jgi:hypothetical protein